MKKAILVLFLLFVLTCSASAAPLTDYARGNFSIDYMYRANADAELSQSGSSVTLDGKAHEFGITAGLGDKVAFQIRNFKSSGLESSTLGPSPYYPEPYLYLERVNLELKSTEFNVMYKLDNNISAFTGLVRSDFSGSIAGTCIHPDNVGNHPIGPNDSYSEKKNIFQIGLIGSTKLGNDLTLYGVAATGKNYRNLEAGLSYAFSKDVSLDLNYRSAKFKNVGSAAATNEEPVYTLAGAETAANNVDLTYKGLGLGLTYKF